jgi:hypothetical protein
MNKTPTARLNENNPIHRDIMSSLNVMDNTFTHAFNGSQNIRQRSPNLEKNLPIIKQFQNQNMMQMLKDFKTPESNKSKSKSKSKSSIRLNKKCTKRKCHKKKSHKKRGNTKRR